MPDREKVTNQHLYICHICGKLNRTQGWLEWHIKHSHPEGVMSVSPARAGPREFYWLCSKCGNRWDGIIMPLALRRCPCGGAFSLGQ